MADKRTEHNGLFLSFQPGLYMINTHFHKFFLTSQTQYKGKHSFQMSQVNCVNAWQALGKAHQRSLDHSPEDLLRLPRIIQTPGTCWYHSVNGNICLARQRCGGRRHLFSIAASAAGRDSVRSYRTSCYLRRTFFCQSKQNSPKNHTASYTSIVRFGLEGFWY